jgi:hypothetical protein
MRDAETALGWPARAGKLVLTLALDRVSDYYRIPRACGGMAGEQTAACFHDSGI